MASNEELLAAAEYVATHDLFELPEGDSDGGQVRYGENAELLARHVRESLAGEGEAITEEWLREIGFDHRDKEEEYYNIIAIEKLSVCADDLIGVHSWCWCGQPFNRPLKTRRQLLSLLSGTGDRGEIVTQRFELQRRLDAARDSLGRLSLEIDGQKFVTDAHFNAVKDFAPEQQVEYLRWALNNDANVLEMQAWIAAVNGEDVGIDTRKKGE